jgi:hypothetical protein
VASAYDSGDRFASEGASAVVSLTDKDRIEAYAIS